MNLLLTFTLNTSLEDWDKIGILDREILIYKRFSRLGINISFLTYGNNSDLNYSNIIKGIDIIPVKEKLNLYRLVFFKILLFPLFNYSLFKRKDIIKTNQMGGSWITWLLKILFRKKLIIRCGYELFKNELYQYRKIKKKGLNFRLIFLFFREYISYRIADCIMITNKFDKNFIIEHFKINSKKIYILPNFIDISLFRPIPTKRKEKIILFIGRLKEEKNLANLIESFKYLENYSLDIIGEGSQKPSLKVLIEKLALQSRIRFLGSFPNSEIPKILNQYHLFILPSLWEGNPKVLLEAMSCGIACIGSKTPGIQEIITHKKNGYLCNFDSKSIAESIKRVYEDIELRKTFGKNAREYVINNNSLEKIVEREISIYKSLLKKK